MKFSFVMHQVEYSVPLWIAYCASSLVEQGIECQIFEVGLDPGESSGL